MMMRIPPSIVLPLPLLLVLLQIVISASVALQQQQQRLVIKPSEEIIRRPLKKQFLLTCRGEGGEPHLFTDFQWVDPNGRLIDSTYENVNIETSSDPGGLLLIFRGPTANDGGTYTCRGKFQNTESFSVEAKVSFYQDISFEDCPETQSLVKGAQNMVIRCTVSASPAPRVAWKKYENDVSSNPRFIIENNGIRLKDDVDVEDGGRYQVRALVEETGDLADRYITVEVHVKPHIEEIVPSGDAIEGEEVKLSCNAMGSPRPFITWYDPQQRNLSAVGGYSVDRNTGLLIISNAHRNEDQGEFTCFAENSAGEEKRAYALTVIVKPIITSFDNITSISENMATFRCRATGMPKPKLTIRKDGVDEPLLNGKDGVAIEEVLDGEETLLIVSILKSSRKDDGLYYCSAENKGGRADKVGHLQIQFKPDLSKTATEVKTWESNPVNLGCIVEAIPNATIVWYFRRSMIQPQDTTYSLKNENGYSNLLVRPMGAQGVGGGDVYGQYTCEAQNNLGITSTVINLGQATVPYPPGPILKIQETPTTISFDIGPPISDGGLAVRKYHASYREDRLSQTTTTSWPATPGSVYKIEHLRPRHAYKIKFAAENDVGIGQWTPEMYYIMPNESVSGANIMKSSGHRPSLLTKFSFNYLVQGFIHICIYYAVLHKVCS